MGNKIKFKRGSRSKLPQRLAYGEPAFVSDEEELYIGTESGTNIKLTSKSEIDNINRQLDTVIRNTMVFVTDFVCDDGQFVQGNGIHDDVTGINKAIEFASNNNIPFVVFPKLTYAVTVDKEGTTSGFDKLGIQIKSNITYICNGATVKSIETNREFYKLLDITECENVVIDNINIVGDRTLRGETEQGHGIVICDSKNITIKNSSSNNNHGDGVIICNKYTGKTYCENINIINVETNNNRRQGISVLVAHGVIIDGCEITNTNGTAPGCGIDIEPDYDPTGLETKDIIIKNCYFEGNKGQSIWVCGKTEYKKKNIKILNNTFNDKNTNILLNYGVENVEIDSNDFNKAEWASIVLNTLDNIKIKDNNFNTTSSHSIYLQKQSNTEICNRGKLIIEKNNFQNTIDKCLYIVLHGNNNSITVLNNRFKNCSINKILIDIAYSLYNEVNINNNTFSLCGHISLNGNDAIIDNNNFIEMSKAIFIHARKYNKIINNTFLNTINSTSDIVIELYNNAANNIIYNNNFNNLCYKCIKSVGPNNIIQNNFSVNSTGFEFGANDIKNNNLTTVAHD